MQAVLRPSIVIPSVARSPAPPAPPFPPEVLVPPEAPPAITKYETPAPPPLGLPTDDTTKLPSPVNVCILKSPDVVTVPPVAPIYEPASKSPTLLSLENNQPFVESI